MNITWLQVFEVITREQGFQFCSLGSFGISKQNKGNREGKNMVGPSFMEDIDCGSFFDHIDDFLDFPTEEITVSLPSDAVGNCDSWPDIWNPESDSLPGSDSVFSNHSASDLSTELSVPYEDIVQLEWMSKFVEDSCNDASLTMKKEEISSDVANKESGQQQDLQTCSPVSVLESSTSCSGKNPAGCSPEVPLPGRCGRARSKRSRPATFSPRPAIQLISSASSISETRQPFVSLKASSDSENVAESHSMIKLQKQVSAENKKKKKIKLSVPLAPLETNQNSPSQAVRKCMHCEITKTPQWRAGPFGPKTLCNACGVRYKSGRLFPEYRPAASPTFIPSIHSNSHKKVLEMRNINKENTPLDSNGTDSSAFPELIPNTHCGLTLDSI